MDKGESETGDRESHLVIGAEDGQSWKAELFYLDQPYVGFNGASTKLKFNHFSSGA